MAAKSQSIIIIRFIFDRLSLFSQHLLLSLLLLNICNQFMGTASLHVSASSNKIESRYAARTPLGVHRHTYHPSKSSLTESELKSAVSFLTAAHVSSPSFASSLRSTSASSLLQSAPSEPVLSRGFRPMFWSLVASRNRYADNVAAASASLTPAAASSPPGKPTSPTSVGDQINLVSSKSSSTKSGSRSSRNIRPQPSYASGTRFDSSGFRPIIPSLAPSRRYSKTSAKLSSFSSSSAPRSPPDVPNRPSTANLISSASSPLPDDLKSSALLNWDSSSTQFKPSNVQSLKPKLVASASHPFQSESSDSYTSGPANINPNAALRAFPVGEITLPGKSHAFNAFSSIQCSVWSICVCVLFTLLAFVRCPWGRVSTKLIFLGSAHTCPETHRRLKITRLSSVDERVECVKVSKLSVLKPVRVCVCVCVWGQTKAFDLTSKEGISIN